MPPRILTSDNSPLRVSYVQASGVSGRIGMTFCPGKKQANSYSGIWERDLETDVAVLVREGVTCLVTLMEAHELNFVQVTDLPEELAQQGIAWMHLPIVDGGIPDAAFEADWQECGSEIRDRLQRGETVVVHCRGGMGRTGMVAACLLVELGVPSGQAIADVRRARHGAIETRGQEGYVRRHRAIEASTTEDRSGGGREGPERTLLEFVRRRFLMDWRGIHGVAHWMRVRQNGRLLAAMTGADREVVDAFALLHDSCRESDGHDPGHGPRAAVLARELRGRWVRLPDRGFELLVRALEGHTGGSRPGDPTVATCWDADRLDFGRLHIRPDPEFLCTSAARDPVVLEWAWTRAQRWRLARERASWR